MAVFEKVQEIIVEELGKDIDREVVFQYLQHLKIAKDFANYY